MELIPRGVAERLEAHAKVIHAFIAGQRRGAAEQFGYAFLAGRALLQAKEIVPNGNARTLRAGFRKWVVVNFPEITIRTAENWMRFAESIMARAQADVSGAPMLLGSAEMSGQSHESILKLVPEVMDGRSMIYFMRECRLLRARRRRGHPPLKGRFVKTGPEKAAQARQVWQGIVADLDTGRKVLSYIEKAEDLKRYLGALVEAGGGIRALLKRCEGGE